MRVMRKQFNLVWSTSSLLILPAFFFPLCFVIFKSSLFLNSSRFCSTSLHLCWLFAYICTVLGFIVFPIIAVGFFPNFMTVVSIIMSGDVLFQIPCLWPKTCSPFKSLDRRPIPCIVLKQRNMGAFFLSDVLSKFYLIKFLLKTIFNGDENECFMCLTKIWVTKPYKKVNIIYLASAECKSLRHLKL